jgi:hypothetical protein
LVDELTWVHDAIRHDLAICRKLADEVTAGATQGQVDEQLRALRTNGPLWQLRVNCLTYCRHVHAHHGLEDALLFPALRRTNPALANVVDKLEADHRDVSDLLDSIEMAAARLGSADSPQTRSALADALTALATVLLEHLAYEEKTIGPTLAQMTDWWR